MKKKQILSWLLVLTLVFSMTAGMQTAFAASPVKISQMTAGSVVKFAGKTWTILNPASGYMLCNGFDGNRRVFDSDNTSSFNPSDPNNIGYYLNNEFYNSLPALDAAMIQSKSWTIENTQDQVVSSVNCKVGILSLQECRSYYNYFGNISDIFYFWTRTWHDANTVRVENKVGEQFNDPANYIRQVLPTIFLSPDTLVLSGTVLGGAQRGVSLSASPAVGGTVTGEGAYTSGAQVTVTATVNDGYTFTNWTKNGAEVSKSLSYSFTQDNNNVSLVANFTGIPHTVAVSSANTNYGTVSGGGSSFIVGDTVTVTATPQSGYCLDNWTENGAIVSVSSNYTFVQGLTDRTLVANFKPIPAGFGTLSGLSVGSTVNFGGKEWILLKPQTGYMILKANLGSRTYDNEKDQPYNPSRTSNVAYFLNNNFLNSLYAGDRSLVQEHTWGVGAAIEPNGIYVTTEDASTVICKVGLLSCGEWKAYGNGTPLSFQGRSWLITPNGVSEYFGRSMYCTYSNTLVTMTPTFSWTELVQPTLYLLPSTLVKNNTVAGGHLNTPVVTGLSPAAGPETGGGQVTISGSGFNGATFVKFGTAEGTGLVVNGDGSLTVTPPAGSGAVDVSVTGPIGTSAVNGNTRYTYNTAQLEIDTNNPPSGTVGTVYTHSFTATGGTGAKTFAVTTGALPEGLTLASDGKLSGTPSKIETSTFTVTVTDSATPSVTDSNAYTMTINPAPLVINKSNPAGGTVGTVYTHSFTATGGTGAKTFTVTAGTLPAGLTLATNGSLSGTPSAIGTSTFTVKATDSATPVVTDSSSYSIIINAKTTNTGGGGGGTVVPEPKPTAPITSTIQTETKIDGAGKASAVVTEKQIKDAVNHAISEATKSKGMEAKVEIKVSTSTEAKTVEISLPKAAVKAVADSQTDAMTASTSVANITFDKVAISTISKEATGDIKVIASKVDMASLSEAEKAVVGDRPVFNFSVTSGDKIISQFGGTVTVSVPYTPKAGEDTNAIVIYYINTEGKMEIVKDCVYDKKKGRITFHTNHFSKYAVGYHTVSFKDVDSRAWYYAAISFVAARGITTGVDNDNFCPEENLTRGQFLVMVMRAYGLEPDSNLHDNFSDAGKTYYTAYLATAKKLGITAGIGNNMFAPEKEISRQEMFTLLYNTLKQIGELPANTSGNTISSYADANEVASWANEAMTLFVKTGTLSGNDGKLNPKDSTNRAQMAQVLYHLMSE